jgi:nitroreductase
VIDLSKDLVTALVDEARLAPSVHNVQPSRWRVAGDRLLLLGDPSRAIPIADPAGRDWRLSHGAHLEGLSLALAARGARLGDVTLKSAAQPGPDGLVEIAACTVVAEAAASPREPINARMSWRGAFKPADDETRADLARLAAERQDCTLVTDRASIAEIAELADRAALFFLRDDRHRAELLEWLRLARAHPRYRLDGLNAEAMCLSPLEAWGAGLVLGPLFRPLDSIGLAAPLVRETAKTTSAAAIVLFHRPVGEDAFESGRAFYRAWLAMERHGLKGCPMSVLADWDESRAALARRHAVPADRHIVSVFRIGRPDGTPGSARARLPVEQLIVTAA